VPIIPVIVQQKDATGINKLLAVQEAISTQRLIHTFTHREEHEIVVSVCLASDVMEVARNKEEL